MIYLQLKKFEKFLGHPYMYMYMYIVYAYVYTLIVQIIVTFFSGPPPLSKRKKYESVTIICIFEEIIFFQKP